MFVLKDLAYGAYMLCPSTARRASQAVACRADNILKPSECFIQLGQYRPQ